MIGSRFGCGGIAVVLLLFVQIRYLPFHEEAVTWAHRLALVADIVMLVLIGIKARTATPFPDNAASAAAVDVSLASGAGSGGDAQGDSLSGIENLVGSSGNDSLAGDAAALPWLAQGQARAVQGDRLLAWAANPDRAAALAQGAWAGATVYTRLPVGEAQMRAG